ncbi:MAG: transglutaminase domain-containing protein [Verrucomicrobiota bacterium]
MKPPPLLLGATLLFWGWQADFLLPGALMAVLLESALVFKARWELADEDFRRVWTFCALLLLASVLYAFTSNEGPSSYAGLFQDANLMTQRNASLSSARTIVSVMCWIPMIFFPFLLAQAFSTRDAIPLSTISLILQRRWKIAKRLGQPLPPERNVNIGFTYFSALLFSASFHPAENQSYFWGVGALLTWALWAHRSRRFALPIWLAALAIAVTLGFLGQQGIGKMQRYIENLSPQWITRFLRRPSDPTQSKTALGRVGNLKLSDAIVIRVEPKGPGPVPAYLREASYRQYRSQIWYAGSSRNDYSPVYEDPPQDSANWTMIPGRSNLSAVNIACYLNGYENGNPTGLLPLPTGTARFSELRAYGLKRSSAGAVLAEGPGLVVFDALYGPGATIDAPPNTGPLTNEDLEVKSIEGAALDQIVEELQLNGRSQPEVLRILSGFFNDRFTYRLWQPKPTKGRGEESPLSRFLLKDRAGHCEYFATATVLLLRKVGIPARYATGYMVHEESGSGYVVRLRDAHAWTLVWDPVQKIWTDFDTTPASWVKEEAKGRSPFRWLGDAWSRLMFEFSKLRWGQSKLRQYLLWIMIPGLALLLYQILFRRGRRRQAKPKSDEEFLANYPGLDSDFYKLEKEIARRGVPREPSQPLNEWLRRVAMTPDFSSLSGPLQELLRLHYRYRFDPLGLDKDDRKALHEQTRACFEILSRTELATSNAGRR